MTTAVNVSVNYLAIIRKALDLAPLFAASTRTVRQINCIENRTMMPVALAVAAYSQEEQSRVRRIAFLNAQLSHQESRHIHSVGAIMTGFVIATDRA